MNKWRKRMREWRKQLGEMEKHSWNWYESYLEAAKQRDAAREREAAALNKAEERGRDNVRLATELARAQGVCEATQAQALKHAATIADLREEENAERRRLEEVLTWQRRVRGIWKVTPEPSVACTSITFIAAWSELGVAIEGEPKEET